MDTLIWMICLLLLLLLPVSGNIFTTDYMSTSCNAVLSDRVSGRLEISPSLTYQNLMDCYTTISVAQDKRILVIFKWFDLEYHIDGTCVDYLDIHDGADTGATRINAEPLCGVQEGVFNVTSSSNYITFYFKSDNSAVFRGVDMIYTAFYEAPCTVEDFACSDGLCINGALQCDGLGQCGDESDEDEIMCTVVQEEEEAGLNIGLVVGCSLGGLVLLIILIVAIYKLVDHYKWLKWLRLNELDGNPWDEHDDAYQYPVSDKYQKHNIGKRGRREPATEAHVVPSGGKTPKKGDLFYSPEVTSSQGSSEIKDRESHSDSVISLSSEKKFAIS